MGIPFDIGLPDDVARRFMGSGGRDAADREQAAREEEARLFGEPTSVLQVRSRQAISQFADGTPLGMTVSLDPRFDDSIIDWDESQVNKIRDAYIATVDGIINDMEVPDSLAYVQATFQAEQMLRRAGVKGVQMAGLINEWKDTLQPDATRRGFRIEDWGSAFFEDQDPRSKVIIDDEGLVPPSIAFNAGGLSIQDAMDRAREMEEDLFRRLTGGRTTPVYVKPDRDVVRDYVRSQLRVLTGDLDDGNVEALTDTFMVKHRQNWDIKEQDIDPAQAVKEAIRKQADYQRIHQFRPADIDEEQWLTTAIGNARSTGVREGVALRRGQDIASLGTTQSTNQGFISQRRGQLDSGFLGQVGAAASAVGRAFR